MPSESSSSSTTSSYSSGVDAVEINDIIINTNINNVIPFIYYGEDKFQADGTNLKFKFRTSTSSYLDYDAILNPTTVSDTTQTAYIPETNDSYYTHTPIFYVDLITDDRSGISKLNVRGQNSIYETRTPKYTYVIPKFTWLNTTVKTSETGTTLADSIGSVWIGSDDFYVRKIEYSSNSTATTASILLDSEIEHIVFNKEGSEMYVTSYDNLYKYTVDHYINTSNEYVLKYVQDKILYNDNNKQMVFFENSELWSVSSYLGKVIQQNTDTLLETYEKTGFDAPFKIKKSNYHGCYIVAGTNMLWSLNNGTVITKYQVNNFKISDFDIGINGEIGITLIGNNESYFRILDKNFYRILFNERITNGNFRFCKYCDNNKFYGIAELNLGTSSYTLTHYLYDIDSGTSFDLTTSNDILESFESSSESAAVSKIEVQYPNGGEVLLLGDTIDIKWKSTESVNDTVKIELYKDSELYETITSSTNNTGVYNWTIPSSLDIATDYKIKITWLAPPPNDYADSSNANFTITDIISSSSEQVVTLDVGKITGIDYDKLNQYVVIVLRDGYLGFFDTNEKTFNGLFNFGISDVNCMAVRNEQIKVFDTVSKVRIFVGSQQYLSDKWDSGEVETNLTSMYYGGGNNLLPGETYYINIQVYSENTGWSEVQSKPFIMPNKKD